MIKKYLDYYIKNIMILLVLLTAINNASSQFNVNFIQKIFSFQSNFEKYFYIFVGIIALIIMFNKNTWLPFLGPSVLPHTLVSLKKNNGNTTIKVIVKPNSKVAYWTTTPSLNMNRNVFMAYEDYSNSGVVQSNENGEALLVINKGTGYNVPTGKYIKPHVHYREITSDLGMMGPVKTVYY